MKANDGPVGEYVGDGYTIRSLSADQEPSVVLSAAFMRELAPVLQAAYARALSLAPGQAVEAVRKLCTELIPLFEHHTQATREWLASRPLTGNAKSLQAQLDEVRRMLDEWR
jgi:hypothetical protein